MTALITKDIIELSNILASDGIIAVPTDTVYGLCARIYSPNTLQKLRNMKKRPETKAFPIMCANLKQIEEICEVNETDKKILETFMPGPLTIILKKKETLPTYINEGLDTIAIRTATSPELEELLLKLGEPVYMTSANLSGEKECENVNDIVNTFPSLDAILDGETLYGQASTIVDATRGYNIVREGPISALEIERALCKTNE